MAGRLSQLDRGHADGLSCALAMSPEAQQYLVLAGIFVALLLAVLVVWRLGRRRRAPKLPAEEKPEEAKPPLELVPPDQRQKPVTEKEKPTALKEGLSKTRGGFIARLSGLLAKKQIDKALVDQMEEILYTADIGAKTATKLFEAVRASLGRNELSDAEAVFSVIRKESEAVLVSAEQQAGPLNLQKGKPFVLLVIGVNGVGKTTTIGKLAAKWSEPVDGVARKVLLAAGDTFRAAATEQLEIWGQRTGCPVVKGKEGGDPSSVIFDAVKRGQAEGFDIVIADTAGRLHTKTNLMEELQKVRRVLQKAQPDAPHEVFLVLDATNGQNAIAQASMFKQAMDITGIVLTKLDGTAKGGVILGICDELKVPVRFIGIGEKVADLREFDAHEFVAALYENADGVTA
jgi:fused signal recognition particle receptor